MANQNQGISTMTHNKDMKIGMKNKTFSKFGMMEEIILRFPHLAQDIFKQLKKQTLRDCLKVDKQWSKFICNEIFPWKRSIQIIMITYNLSYNKHWNEVLKNVPYEILKQLYLETKSFLNVHLTNAQKRWSPLHISVENGNFDLCKFIMKRTSNGNPEDQYGSTAFHWAVQKGHVDICRYLMENLDDKNPTDMNGDIPFHYAAKFGQFDVCKIIIENLEDKDPVNYFGNTPLHLAAERGHLDICRLLVKSGVNKETQNHAGEIPLNLATINDNLRVGVFLISNMDHVQLFFNNLNKEIIYFLKIILLWLLDWIILTLGSGILYYCCFSIAPYDWKFFPIPSFAFSIFWVSLIHRMMQLLPLEKKKKTAANR